MSDNSADYRDGIGEPSTGKRGLSIRPGVVLAVLLVAALIAFVIQNDSRVPVSWLFLSWEGPLWAVIIIAAVAGIVLGQVLSWLVRLSKWRKRR